MKRFNSIIWLLILASTLIPLFSCAHLKEQLGLEPSEEEKWPVITDTRVITGDLNMKWKTINTPPGWQINPMSPEVTLEVDLMTCDIGQEFTAKVILQRIRREYNLFIPPNTLVGDGTDDYPFDLFNTHTDNPVDDPRGDPTEEWVIDGIFGTYFAGSGHPPQGKVTLSFKFEPDWLPILATDWWWLSDEGYYKLTNRYVYLFEVIIQDKGGRTDVYDFTMSSQIR